MNLLLTRSSLIACVCLLAGAPALSQTVRVLADSGRVGQRIVMLKGMGEVHSPLDSAHVASAVGINLVTAVVRVEGHRLASELSPRYRDAGEPRRRGVPLVRRRLASRSRDPGPDC